MKVMKFGGGCLKDPDHFIRVSDIIISDQDKNLVVVSAVSGITDTLIDAIQKTVKSESYVRDILKMIGEKHHKIIEQILKDNTRKKAVFGNVKTRMKKLEHLLCGISCKGEVTPSVKAHILSYGERLSALILSALLNEKGEASIPMEADRIGMVTDGSLENATAILPEVKKNLSHHVLPWLKEGIIPVVTGYFGRTREGNITTFGRNGTDYSAAVIASALDASLLELWKDVDGFMSADPKIVREAKHIDRLSYYEAAELSYFGAKILYPRTVEPLIKKGIPMVIKNIYERQRCGTLVRNGIFEQKNIIKSITFNRNISVLRIHGPGVGYKPGIIAQIGNILSDMGINIYSVITSQTCINLLLDRTDSRRGFEALQKLAGGVIEKIDQEENIALVGVVGSGLLKKQGVAARVFSAVASEKINVEMISYGASEVAYYFIVLEKDVERAIQAVHKEFF